MALCLNSTRDEGKTRTELADEEWYVWGKNVEAYRKTGKEWWGLKSEQSKSKAWVKAQDEKQREGGRIGNEVHCHAAEGPD